MKRRNSLLLLAAGLLSAAGAAIGFAPSRAAKAGEGCCPPCCENCPPELCEQCCQQCCPGEAAAAGEHGDAPCGSGPCGG
jgi:hypothetical protein